MASVTADNVAWERYAVPADAQDSDVLARITFSTVSSARPLHTIVDLVAELFEQSPQTKNVIVMAGRSRRMAVESHTGELQELIVERGASMSSMVPKTLGDVGAALVVSGATASLLVLQAASSS